LPAVIDGRSVATYQLVRSPALSWLVGRSFFWRTRPGDTGAHTIRLRATYADAPPDTVALRVDVAAPDS
jgi:hypothetical protein